MRRERVLYIGFVLFILSVVSLPASATFWIQEFDLTASRPGWTSGTHHFTLAGSTDVTASFTGYQEVRYFGAFYTAPTGGTVDLYGGLKIDNDGVMLSYDWWFMVNNAGTGEDILGGDGDLTITMEDIEIDLTGSGLSSDKMLRFARDVTHVYYQGTEVVFGSPHAWQHIQIPGYRTDHNPPPYSRSPVRPFTFVDVNESSFGFDPSDPRYGQADEISASRVGNINTISLELPDIFVPDNDIQLVHFGTGFDAAPIPEPASIALLVIGAFPFVLLRKKRS